MFIVMERKIIGPLNFSNFYSKGKKIHTWLFLARDHVWKEFETNKYYVTNGILRIYVDQLINFNILSSHYVYLLSLSIFPHPVLKGWLKIKVLLIPSGTWSRCQTTGSTCAGRPRPLCCAPWCQTSRASTTAGGPTWSSPTFPSQTGLSCESRWVRHVSVRTYMHTVLGYSPCVRLLLFNRTIYWIIYLFYFIVDKKIVNDPYSVEFFSIRQRNRKSAITLRMLYDQRIKNK